MSVSGGIRAVNGVRAGAAPARLTPVAKEIL
jgi:hypothetical protein